MWSPRGDYIAFTGLIGSQFAIGILKPDGSGERILTEGLPQRRPDLRAQRAGDHVLPRSRAGAVLFTIDITGRNELKEPTPSYRLRSGLVAAVVVTRHEAADRFSNAAPVFSPALNHQQSLPGCRAFKGAAQGSIKVDGTFD